ncbi:MAG: hypothetical protein J6Z45_05220 [Oscillospiraceae bacterium]|nr:hypothetical protein [Oscillospiraceae bacterium]
MNEQAKPAAAFAKAALILFLIRMAAGLLIQIFPAAAAVLIGGRNSTADFSAISPLMRLMPLAIAAGVFLLCYGLVMSSIRSDDHRSARLALTVIMVVLTLNPNVSIVRSYFTSAWLDRTVNPSAIAAYQILQTADGLAGMIASIAYPLLTSAAAINWYRTREPAPQTPDGVMD